VINLGKNGDNTYDIGYRHGRKHPLGNANLVFLDGHVGGFNLRQTNNVLVDIKTQ
jgi:prepilin-type processing-associated H-X9-DG protein